MKTNIIIFTAEFLKYTISSARMKIIRNKINDLNYYKSAIESLSGNQCIIHFPAKCSNFK